MARLTAPLAALALIAVAALPASACPGKVDTTASGPATPITTAQGPMTPVPTTVQQ